MSDFDTFLIVLGGVLICALYVWYICKTAPEMHLYINGKEVDVYDEKYRNL